MTLSEVLKSLPNGFHDAHMESFTIDWNDNKIVMLLDVWMDQGPSENGKYDEKYLPGKLELKELSSLYFDPKCFTKFTEENGAAWLDIGADFARVNVPDSFKLTPTSGWIYFFTYNGFILFDAKNVHFEWIKQS